MKRAILTLILLVTGLLPGTAIADVVLQTIISNGQVVTGVTDRVVVIRNKKSVDVLPGLVLRDGDELSTLPAAQVVLLREPGSVEIYVGENSEIQISSIFLRLGEIYVRVKNRLKHAFEVKSDYGVAGVEGTEFILKVDDNPDTSQPFTCVTVEGKVRFTAAENAEEPVLVAAGQEFTLNADRQPALSTLSREALNRSAAQYAPLIEIHRRQSRDVQVPYLIGMQEQNAESVLKTERLSVGKIEYVLSGPDAVIGVVLEQDPQTGATLPPFDPVSLVVEGVPTEMPDLIGLNEDEMLAMLEELKLQLGERKLVIDLKIPKGTIVSQSIEAGELIPEGTAIDIGVSSKGVRPLAPFFDRN